MMNDAFDLRLAESHIEVHKFRSGAIVVSTFLALVLQAFVPVYIPKFAVLDLPLLVVIYFGLSRPNPSTGLLLGSWVVYFEATEVSRWAGLICIPAPGWNSTSMS